MCCCCIVVYIDVLKTPQTILECKKDTFETTMVIGRSCLKSVLVCDETRIQRTKGRVRG